VVSDDAMCVSDIENWLDDTRELEQHSANSDQVVAHVLVSEIHLFAMPTGVIISHLIM
jgi:hypothetical protein